ncbi:diaminobutyrate--2-oxoglutarate transaminase [Novosphingobium beihaiensis]|uniref:Diaminobutyrate--2-oxoglutarate transaminase n=1 Tax=Novosphingobium beihaiensis TaxID=2930389 RepID=A0ABT0BTA3_9SPHN|nr:diaminobutyrate--2-oxoglutarate transaminase [Novosphingobium beihaiensis]MCJ2188286.1 diaminobutyrate--2-oxoglutarate transaminase [Novosphingobium beihaiensis]
MNIAMEPFALDQFRGQAPIHLRPDPILHRQEGRESNARSYPRRIPLVLTGARGIYVQDSAGQLYVDCLAGAGTLALGHNHPAVIAALREALDSGAPLHTLDLPTRIKDAFVETLFASLPAGLQKSRVQFCGPSGSDAVEAALKLVRTATGRKAVVGFSGAYHGMTAGALSLMGNLAVRMPLGGAMGDAHMMPYPYDFRCPFGIGGEQAVDAHLQLLEQVLNDPESGVPAPAAVLLEVVQGEGGVIPAPIRWLQGVRRLTQAAGVPLVIDEIQTGVGRTGTFFAFEQAGIEPDVLVLSKAIGGGLPMAVMICREELDRWAPGAHAGTFRGNQLAMAAGVTTIGHVRDQALHRHAAAMGERLAGHLRAVQADFPAIGDVRGRGLMIGVEIVEEPAPRLHSGPNRVPPPADGVLARAIQRACLEHGLIVETGGRHGAVLRFLCPLIVTPEEIDEIAERFRGAVRSACAAHVSEAAE